MELLEVAQKTLWFAPVIGEAVLVAALMKKRLYRELPIFATYLAFVCVHDVVLAVFFDLFSVAYFYTYWITELMIVALGLAVLFEVFNVVLKPYQSVQRLGNILFLVATVLLAGIAVLTAATTTNGDSHPLVAAILTAEIAVRIVQTGLALFLFIFASALGLTWRHVVFGVAMGFGLYAASELVVVTMRSHFGVVGSPAFILLKPAAFLCSVLVWFFYLLRREPVMVLATRVSNHYDIAEWNHTLSGYLHQ